jgi:predicted DNA-binding transcriptional regulator AlpA
MQDKSLTPIAVSIADAVKISGIGRTTIYAIAKRGDLPLRRVGGRTLVLVDDLVKLIVGEAA